MSAKAWGGVFSDQTDARVEEFTESISFDQRLFRHDILGSIAHARMLASTGLIGDDEADRISSELQAIGREIENGEFEFRLDLEDIHMHIERKLIDRLGDIGRKLHTARSRNDQISTDLRLWTRDAIDRTSVLVRDLQIAFISRCEQDSGVIVPAYTHMRRAQPVLANHYWTCYCEKLERGRERLKDARRRTNVLSLGAAAVAGTSLPIDREFVRRELGFEGIAKNSLDVSSDRDFVVETVFAHAMIAEHLSTWAEEWILWSGDEFGFLMLPQSFCTGSSIMPQKINPDVLELIRGKTARVLGDLHSLLVLIKGLPLAYNRDLQEDKVPLFDAIDTVQASLELACPLVAQTLVLKDRIAATLDLGYLDATTVMERLILMGVPQRSAHELAGRLVKAAMDLRLPLKDVPLALAQEIDPRIDRSVLEATGAVAAVQAFKSFGSTAPDMVRDQVAKWRERLGLVATTTDQRE